MGYFDNFKLFLFFLPSRKLATDKFFAGDIAFKEINTSHVVKMLKDSFFSVTQVLPALSGLTFSPGSVSVLSLWCFQ